MNIEKKIWKVSKIIKFEKVVFTNNEGWKRFKKEWKGHMILDISTGVEVKTFKDLQTSGPKLAIAIKYVEKQPVLQQIGELIAQHNITEEELSEYWR